MIFGKVILRCLNMFLENHCQVRREIRRENVGVEMKQLLSTENSIYSPRNWSWSVPSQVPRPTLEVSQGT